jgi:hypothetical protein
MQWQTIGWTDPEGAILADPIAHASFFTLSKRKGRIFQAQDPKRKGLPHLSGSRPAGFVYEPGFWIGFGPPIALASLGPFGDNGTVLRGMVSGDQVQWDPPTRQGDHELNDIASVPGANLLVAVGDNGTVLRGTVSGDQVRWDPPTRQGDQDLYGIVSVPGANLLVAVGAGGTVLRGTVSGDQVRWDPPTKNGDENLFEDLFGIASVPGANLLVVEQRALFRRIEHRRVAPIKWTL